MRWLSGVREKWLAWLHDRSGIAAAFTAIIMVVLLAFAAMVIDVGHMVVAKGELQNAADAAALAGARGYFPPTPPSGPLTPNCTTAKQKAKDYVNNNYADTQALFIADGDIQTGTWTWGSPGSFTEKTQTDLNSFKPSGSTVLAIQVTVRKNPGAINNNPVAMTLAAVFGVTEMNVAAAAVAVNDLPLGSNPLCGTFLFAIPDCLATSACDPSKATNQKYLVKFSNDPNDTAGWANFASPVNAADQSCLAQSLCSSTLNKGKCKGTSYCQPAEQVKPCPGGTPVYVQNGVVDSVMQDLATSLATCGSLKFIIPVVEGADCTTVKWTGTKCLVGYAEFVIDPNDPDVDFRGYVNPDSEGKWVPPGNPGMKHEIKGYVRCLGDWGEGTPSGDASDYYGTVSLVPKLVR